MPRRKQSQAAVSAETQEKIDVLLEDFDNLAAQAEEKFMRETDALIHNLRYQYHVEVMQLSAPTRNMLLEDYLDQLEKKMNDQDKENVKEDSNENAVDAKVDQIKHTVMRTGRKGRNVKAPRAVASTAKKTRGRGAAAAAPTPSSFRTPAHSSALPDFGKTPFITPKFNPATPLTGMVSRVAKPNEVLISLSGSPVAPVSLRSRAARAEADNSALIPLGDNNTLNVPIHGDDVMDLHDRLDEAQWQQLKALHQKLDNMIKMKD